MRIIYNISGNRMELQPKDLDGDGIVGEIETVTRGSHDSSAVDIVTQKSELGEVVDVLNNDVIESEGMSSFDKLANLNLIQIPAITSWDFLCKNNFFQRSALNLTRQLKRLSVSQDGMRSHQIVDMTGRKQQTDAQKTGFGEKIKSFFGGNTQQ